MTSPPLPLASSPTSGTPYFKNGHWVVDTPALDNSGHVPTHRLDQPTNKQPGESWTDYQQRVLSRQSFSPDTAQTSRLSALQPDVADSTTSLLQHAAAEGVHLTPSETRRSQERQEMLFQKGRSAPGDVATWTLTSDHTPGRAVDFSGSPSALQWLQHNAPTHGFSVMGDMDPGHVSMPTGTAGPQSTSAPLPAAPSPRRAPVTPLRTTFRAEEPPVMPSKQPFYAEAPPDGPPTSAASGSPASPAPSGPNVELELAKLANDAMQNGADPHDVTTKLHQTISYLRQFPQMAQHATNALADGVASPADISRTLWPHVSALSHASGSNAPTDQEAANLPPDNTARSRIGGGLAAFASGTPGGEAFVTGAHALVNREPYRDAYRDVQAAENSSPIKTPLKLAGALPAAMALPGSPVASGAVVGGADQALSANPDESLTERGVRTVAGAGAGAVVGKAAQKVGTVISSLRPAILGGTGGADANLIARQAARAQSAKQLYDAAITEGRSNEAGPAIQSFLAEDDIAPIVEKIRAGRTGSQMDTPELLDNVYKALSDAERAAKKPLAAVDPTKPNTATNTLANIRAAKNKFLRVVSSPDTKPPLSLDVAPEVTTVEPRITPEREPLAGPVQSRNLSEVTTAPPTTHSQLMRNAPNGPAGNTPPMQGAGGPAFQLGRQPQVVKPGVEISTPGMRIQTAPAEALPPMMPSYQKAVEDYAQRSQEINALKRGYQALQQNAGREKLPPVNSLGKKTPLGFADWAKTASPQELAAARQGITGGVRDAAALKNGLTFKPLRNAASAAGPLLRSTPSPNQEWLDAARNLGLLETGNQVTQP